MLWVTTVVLHNLALGEDDVMASSMVFIERVMAFMTFGSTLSYWSSFTLR